MSNYLLNSLVIEIYSKYSTFSQDKSYKINKKKNKNKFLIIIFLCSLFLVLFCHSGVLRNFFALNTL